MDTTKKDLLKKASGKKFDPMKALDNAFSEMDAERKGGENLMARKGIASGLKDLSKRGALTASLLGEAKERALKTGLSEDQFSSFLDKERIKTSNFAEAPATSSPEEATQNVMFQKQYGSGLGALAAMQDPNYELGSGSSLRQPARSIGTKSGALKRASRRLRRKGYGAQAGQMAMASEIQRLKEPSISSDATRAADMARRIEAGRLKQQQDQLMSKRDSLFSKLLDKMPSMGGDKGEVEELKTETARRSADAEKRRKERQSLFGNRLNATRNT